MKYLLDTNICIHLIQQHPEAVLQRLASLTVGDAVMSVITYAELRAGIERVPAALRANDEQVLERLTGFIPVMPFDVVTARHYGLLRAAVPDRRRDAMDRLIAAHARSLGLTLVTHHEADFLAYPGLSIENWVTGQAFSGPSKVPPP